MKNSDSRYLVNPFRPKSAGMKGEVRAIFTVLAIWGLAAFGFQLWLQLSAGATGKSPLEGFTFFNLPFHFWFTAQMLPLGFIIICTLFNFIIDRLSAGQRRKRGSHYD